MPFTTSDNNIMGWITDIDFQWTSVYIYSLVSGWQDIIPLINDNPVYYVYTENWVIMMPTLSSLVASATNDDKVGIMTTSSFW